MTLYKQVIKEAKGKEFRVYTPASDEELLEELQRRGLVALTGDDGDGRVGTETGEETRDG